MDYHGSFQIRVPSNPNIITLGFHGHREDPTQARSGFRCFMRKEISLQLIYTIVDFLENKNMNIKKNNKGFSLVELLVVIAIMAILAAVAVVGVSIYVPKAREAADAQMISDIEDALILGAYSKLGTPGYTPGSVVGAVGLNEGANATATEEDWDGNGISDIQEIMVSAFGEGWEEQLRKQSDKFSGGNRATVLKAMQDAKANNYDYFDSVPDSSFFGKDGNTDAIVSDVDEIASALQGVLEGNAYAFSQFWGEDFRASVETGGLKDTWKQDGNDQMAANLTVFAAANQIQNITTSNAQEDKDRMQGWIDSWNGDDVGSVSTSTNGYCADLVMQYGQCVAFYNYMKNKYSGQDEADLIEGRYVALEKAMVDLKSPTEGYVQDFNKAIKNFWKNLDSYRAEWQAPLEGGGKSQARKDAEALLASMTAVNSLESDYVNKSQSGLLNSANAFEQAGAAGILDTMVAYAKLDELPAGACAVILAIHADGTPIVYSPLQDNENK